MEEMKKQETDLIKKSEEIKQRAEETEAQLIAEHKKATTKLTEKHERDAQKAEEKLTMVNDNLGKKVKECEEL